MSSKSLARTIHLKFFTSMVAMLLAALEVTAETGSADQTQETGGVVSGGAKASYNNHAVCYDNRNQEVTCTRKKAIIVGSVIGALFTILGVLYLYVTFSERRKRRKNRSILEENEPLSDGVRCPDCEKGVAQASKKGEADGYYLHPDVSDGASVSRTTSTVSNYGRPPSFNQVHQPLGALDSGYAPLSRP